LVASIAGFVPATIFKLHGGSANYFMEPQLWLALCFTLAYVESTEDLVRPISLSRKIILAIVFAGFLFGMFGNFKRQYNKLGYKNLTLRKYMIDKTTNLDLPRRKALEQIFDATKTMKENLATILFEPQKSIRDDVEFKFFQSLQQLKKTEDKANTFLFIENKHGLHSAFSCNAIPLAVPVLTGMATLHGIPYDYCPATDYGFDQHPLEPRTEIGRLNRPVDLCAEIEKAGKTKLIILNYNDFMIASHGYFNCETLLSNSISRTKPRSSHSE
jgi:hypothetical protein